MAKAKKQTKTINTTAHQAVTPTAPKATNTSTSKIVSQSTPTASKATNTSTAKITSPSTSKANVQQTINNQQAAQKAVGQPSAIPSTANLTKTQATPSYSAPYYSPNTSSQKSINTSSSKPVSTPTSSSLAPASSLPIDFSQPTIPSTAPTMPDNAVQSLFDTVAENREGADLTSMKDVLSVEPNETPAQRTERWLSNMNLLGNANTNFARNNVIRNAAQNNSKSALQQSLEDAAYRALVGENGIYEEVPNMGGGSVFDAILNPTAIIPKNGTGKQLTPLEQALANAASSALGNAGLTAGNGTTPGTVYQQILDPERYAQLANPGTEINNIIDAASKTVGGTGSKGGTRGGSGGGSGASGVGGLAEGGYDLSELYDLIERQLAEYDNGFNTLMQNLLNAYNANYGSLNDSYLAALNALGLNYQDTEDLLNNRLASSQQALEDARRRAMQEAYIARMMDQKNIEDYLGAAGFSGGATESVLSSLLNNYRSNRNKIEENTQASLRDLLQTYLDNMSNARQRYNEGLLSAENNRMSAAQNLANGLYESQANAASNYSNQRANVYSNLYDTLAKLALKG